MLTARMGDEVVRAGQELKERKAGDFLCRDEHCQFPELELVIGRGLRTPHFRHKRRGECCCPDGETEWHLAWKALFERVEEDMGVDPVTGEHNRADAVVGTDFVIEFQHSHIDEKEQSDRERFYGSKGGMLWIADASGVRSLNRYRRARFERYTNPALTDGEYRRLVFADETIPPLWRNRDAGVVLDYGETHDLVYILPQRGDKSNDALCRIFKKDEFVALLKEHPEAFRYGESELIAQYEERQREEARLKEEVEKRNAEFRKRLEDAWKAAILRQRSTPPPHIALEPVPGTDLVVGSNGLVYPIVDGRCIDIYHPVCDLRRRLSMVSHRRGRL